MNSISIIIPTYNRAHLIGETLDSILAQTYSNWECLIVDDGSTDESQTVFDNYAAIDSRFRFFKRPPSKPKGANACRNIGLENATGDYVIFFDSDDLMTENHIAVKLNAIEKHHCDYSITRTKYFNKDSSQIDEYYQFDKHEITTYNYIAQKINWLTLDICLDAKIAKKIRFNETLQSGQEYNYFSKLVHISTNAFFVNEVVSLRRFHEESIRSQLKSEMQLKRSVFTGSWLTFLDTKDMADDEIQKILLYRCCTIAIEKNTIFDAKYAVFFHHLSRVYGYPSLYLLMYLISKRLFNKGYYFRTKFLRGVKKI